MYIETRYLGSSCIRLTGLTLSVFLSCRPWWLEDWTVSVQKRSNFHTLLAWSCIEITLHLHSALPDVLLFIFNDSCEAHGYKAGQVCCRQSSKGLLIKLDVTVCCVLAGFDGGRLAKGCYCFLARHKSERWLCVQ